MAVDSDCEGNDPRAVQGRGIEASTAGPGAQGEGAPNAGGGADALHRAPRRGRSIGLTGADSFIGRHLVGLLEEDPTVTRVVVMDLKRPSTAGAKTRFYEVDLTEPSVDARLSEILKAERVETVVHLAFLSSPTKSVAFAHELESVGTMHLLNACREQGVKRFVLRSQTMLYGPHRDNPNYLREDAPLRGLPGATFLSDKIDAERETQRFAQQHETEVIVLRLAPLMGPSVQNYLSQWLGRLFVPTLLGHDPLFQCIHELDAVVAFKLALDHGRAGVYNIVADGVVPISTAVKLAGRFALPIPYPLAKRATALMWTAHLNEAPASFLNYLRYLCVADGEKARRELGFQAAYTTKEAILDFGGALRLRDARLLQEVRA